MSRNQQKGFTLVELMLSMAFISVMLIAIMLCVIQMTSIYTRGETLRQVNQASRSLAIDLRQSFGAAGVSAINLDRVNDKGRLCTGAVSYIWNTLNADGTDKYPNNVYTGAASERPRFVKVIDIGGRYCRDNGGNGPINKAAAQPVELLQAGDRSLMVRKLSVTPAMSAGSITQRLYDVTVMLGTDNIREINTTTDSCNLDSEVVGGTATPGSESNPDYCAVNEFSLTVRAGIR